MARFSRYFRRGVNRVRHALMTIRYESTGPGRIGPRFYVCGKRVSRPTYVWVARRFGTKL